MYLQYYIYIYTYIYIYIYNIYNIYFILKFLLPILNNIMIKSLFTKTMVKFADQYRNCQIKDMWSCRGWRLYAKK